jgi:hypothetical protein
MHRRVQKFQVNLFVCQRLMRHSNERTSLPRWQMTLITDQPSFPRSKPTRSRPVRTAAWDILIHFHHMQTRVLDDVSIEPSLKKLTWDQCMSVGNPLQTILRFFVKYFLMLQ